MQYAQERDANGTQLRFKECKWPPPAYSQADGYSEVVVNDVTGPGTYEATGATHADRIATGCARVVLGYTYQNMGADEHLTPFLVSTGQIVNVDGTPWVKDSPAPLPFYPDRGETDVIRNGKYRLDGAYCAPPS